MTEEILKLRGKEAKKFLEDDRRELTKEEKQSLRSALKYYKAHCKA